MANGAKVVKGHTVMGELLSAGQFSVAASNYSYLVQRAADKGAPVAYQPFVQPVIARPQGAALMKTAPHPAAALLFVDWLLTEGQQVIVDLGLTPSIEPEGLKDPLEGLEVIPVDVDKLLNEAEAMERPLQRVAREERPRRRLTRPRARVESARIVPEVNT